MRILPSFSIGFGLVVLLLGLLISGPTLADSSKQLQLSNTTYPESAIVKHNSEIAVTPVITIYLPLVHQWYKLIDSDNDGLSDYEENVKYLTDPHHADSDRDGTYDGDWNERREYVYTVRVLMKIRSPFDIRAMNDLYQDVRILSGPNMDGYTQIEAMIYPETDAGYLVSTFPLDNIPDPLKIYTQPGIATNYSQGMQSEVNQIVAGAKTDEEAIDTLLKWVLEETTYYIDYSIPEVYFTYLEDSEVKLRNYHGPLPEEELLRTHYFADSMFQMRTHGTCTSRYNQKLWIG